MSRAGVNFARTRRRPVRQGQTLLMVALLLVAFFGIAALAIDVGLLRLSQLQMQAAADSASLEGMRYRDETPTGVGAPSPTNDERFAAAGQMVGWTLGEDRDLELAEGVLELSAGDFVETIPVGEVQETADEQRNDFVATDDARAPAVLARLRRRVARQELTDLSDSSDPNSPLPVLFEAGALPPLDGSGSPGASRLDGFAIRGTAIAHARRVLSIGRANDATGRPGLVPLAVSRSTWNSWNVGATQTITVTASGNWDSDAAPLGLCFTITASTDMPLDVGKLLPPPQRIAAGTYAGYVPIYAAIADAVSPTIQRERVVAFGAATAIVNSTGDQLTIVKQLGRVAAVNASARWARQPGLRDAEWTNTRLAGDSVNEPLLAPALAR